MCVKSEIYCLSLEILENQGNTFLMKTLTIPSLSNETNGNEFWISVILDLRQGRFWSRARQRIINNKIEFHFRPIYQFCGV